jgi:hypothetical protein
MIEQVELEVSITLPAKVEKPLVANVRDDATVHCGITQQ